MNDAVKSALNNLSSGVFNSTDDNQTSQNAQYNSSQVLLAQQFQSAVEKHQRKAEQRDQEQRCQLLGSSSKQSGMQFGG